MKKDEKFQWIKISVEEYNELMVVEKKIKSIKLLKRIQTFKLIYVGWKYTQIADFLMVTNNTISNWIKIYKSGGISALITYHYKGGQSKLNNTQLLELKKESSKGSFPYAKAAKKHIEEKYGVVYHLNHVQKLLKKKFVYTLKKPEEFLVKHQV